MKILKLKFIVVAALAFGIMPSQVVGSVLITGFGNLGLQPFAETYSDFTTTQTGSTFQIVGSDLGDSLFGSFPSVDISGYTQLSLVGTIAVANSSTFQFEIFDVDDNSLLFQGSFGDFVVGIQTEVFLSLVPGGEGIFNGNAVLLGLITNGLGSTVNLTMDSLTAVPEPSTYLLLGLGGVALWALRRRRRAVR